MAGAISALPQTSAPAVSLAQSPWAIQMTKAGKSWPWATMSPPAPAGTPAAQAINLSTRLRVLTDANVGIGGFIFTGTQPKHIVVRGIGPSLSNFGVPNPLADPFLELHSISHVITNDNWR